MKSSAKFKHSKRKAKSEGRNGVGRLIAAGLIIIAQVVFLSLELLILQKNYPWISIISWMVSIITALLIQSTRKNSAIKLPWIILILSVPILGISIYLLTQLSSHITGMPRRYEITMLKIKPHASKGFDTVQEIESYDATAANIFRYVQQNSGYGAFKNTRVDFYGDARKSFEQQLADISRAKKYVFLEYFAIEDTRAFHMLEEILVAKVREGVKVRILYDDIGSIGYISRYFYKRMLSYGIECCMFNPVVPIWKAFLNHRDHRKITVIDGEIGFTGGYNLADEYFGITKPYGEWKDSALRLEGEAVKNLLLIFLELWDSAKNDRFKDEDFTRLFSDKKFDFPDSGFVQPYAVSPLTECHIGEDVYMNIINSAQKYLYITTPYLLIMDEVKKALTLAARRGVDVRIITPGIPDKKYVFEITRSYYGPLVKEGVRIFEYTPGFCHAKQLICDGRIATCGTVNFDFRSFYHHFENGVILYKCSAIQAIHQDFEVLFSKCTEVSSEYKFHRTLFKRFKDGTYRLIAPVL